VPVARLFAGHVKRDDFLFDPSRQRRTSASKVLHILQFALGSSIHRDFLASAAVAVVENEKQSVIV
jgi:hypothetical protein